MKAVHFSNSMVTVSGSMYMAIISSERSKSLPAREKGPMQPP